MRSVRPAFIAPLLAALAMGTSAFADPVTIVVDPGHGGTQDGAEGPGHVWEKDLSLSIARKLAQRLRADLKARVILTREKDEHVFLQKRIELANDHGADLFVSIHLNSMPTNGERRRVTGVETYFLSADASGADAARVAAAENADAEGRKRRGRDDVATILDDLTLTAAHQDASRLAYAVQTALVKDLGAVDRGVQQAPFMVLMGAQMPAILVEAGFISNPTEGKALATAAYQEKIAGALEDGVKRYLAEIAHRDVAAASPTAAKP